MEEIKELLIMISKQIDLLTQITYYTYIENPEDWDKIREEFLGES